MPRRPAPLTDPFWPVPSDETLRFLQVIWQMEHALGRASKRMEDTLRMSGPQRFTLRLVGARPGITPTEIATGLHLHPSTITGILKRLEARGLVRRETNRSDGRVAHFFLTASGERADVPTAKGTIEHAVRSTLRRCTGTKRKAAVDVLHELTRELLKIADARA